MKLRNQILEVTGNPEHIKLAQTKATDSLEKIADDFAIGFYKWVNKNESNKEVWDKVDLEKEDEEIMVQLLEIYKQTL